MLSFHCAAVGAHITSANEIKKQQRHKIDFFIFSFLSDKYEFLEQSYQALTRAMNFSHLKTS
jgi:hypothetical protein